MIYHRLIEYNIFGQKRPKGFLSANKGIALYFVEPQIRHGINGINDTTYSPHLLVFAKQIKTKPLFLWGLPKAKRISKLEGPAASAS